MLRSMKVGKKLQKAELFALAKGDWDYKSNSNIFLSLGNSVTLNTKSIEMQEAISRYCQDLVKFTCAEPFIFRGKTLIAVAIYLLILQKWAPLARLKAFSLKAEGWKMVAPIFCFRVISQSSIIRLLNLCE